MKVINQGSMSWLIVRESTGRVTWSVLSNYSESGERYVVKRGESKSGVEALRQAIGEVVAFMTKKRS